MSSLKSLRIRMNSIKSTRKMTQAMKLVSASKLRKAKEVLDGGRPYFNAMEKATIAMLKNVQDKSEYPIAFRRGHDSRQTLLVVFGSNKGLCGSFNVNLVKRLKQDIEVLTQDGVGVEIICVGKKVYELLRHLENKISLSSIELSSKEELEHFASDLTHRFHENLFDNCYVYYNHFISVMSQEISKKRLVPLFKEDDLVEGEQDQSITECLPDSGKLVNEMVPKVLLSQILAMFQESQASEHGSRMSSMDNATRNAGEMLKTLNTVYNRTRQAAVTTELIEILSGAEAIKSN